MLRLAFILACASYSVAVAQTDSKNVAPPVANEKTVGAASNERNIVSTADDSNTVGNAKTVGGDPNTPRVEVDATQDETVGNSKTVGGR
jgi:hypothetical protein